MSSPRYIPLRSRPTRNKAIGPACRMTNTSAKPIVATDPFSSVEVPSIRRGLNFTEKSVR